MNEALGALVAGIFILALYFIGQALEPAICPHPVRAAGSDQILSCSGQVTLVAPTPVEAKR